MYICAVEGKNPYMEYPKKKKYKTKKKFRKISFKLSKRQLDIIKRYCKYQDLTPNKLIKTAIREYLEKYKDDIPEEEDYISENQLKLWDFDADTQMEMSFEIEEEDEDEDEEIS